MRKGFASSILVTLIIGLVVGATAVFTYFQFFQNKIEPVLTIQSPAPKTSVISEPNGSTETANWKTFTSSNLGFFIKHPDYMNIDETEASLILFKGELLETLPGSPIDPYPSPTIGFLARGGNSAQDACDIEICGSILYYGDDKVGMSFSDVKFNNVGGVKITNSNRDHFLEYYLANSDASRIYRVKLIAGQVRKNDTRTERQKKDDFEILQEMISTFQFLD